MKLPANMAEKIYDGTVPAISDYGFNGEDWQAEVLEFEVGRTDKSFIPKTFDFSLLKNLK